MGPPAPMVGGHRFIPCESGRKDRLQALGSPVRPPAYLHAFAKVPAELGQSARVFVQTADVIPLSVPLSALTAENGATYVWVVSANNTLKKTPVRTGPFGEKTVPVLEGLNASDWVVAAGVHVLLEGQQVRPVDRSNRVVNLADKE